MDNQNEHPEEVVDSQSNTQGEHAEDTINEESISSNNEVVNDAQQDAETSQSSGAITPSMSLPEADNPSESPIPQSITPPLSPKKKSHKALIISIVIATVLIATAVLLYFFVFKKKPAPVVVPTKTTNSQTVTPVKETLGAPSEALKATSNNASYINQIFIDPKVTWQKPTETDMQGYFVNEQRTPDGDSFTIPENINYIRYYLAGSFSDGKIIYAVHPLDGPGYQLTEVFMQKTGEQKATLLYRYENLFKNAGTTEDTVMSGNQLNKEKVTVNFDTLIANTWAPDGITLNGQKLKLPSFVMATAENPDFSYTNNVGSIVIDSKNTGTTVSTVPEGTIYEITTPKDGYKLSLFELELPNHFRVSYQLDGEISRSTVPPITWTDGSKNTSEYASFGAGCGSGYYSLIADITKDGLTQIGTSDGGQPIYIFKDMAGKVAKQILSEVNSRPASPYPTFIEDKDAPFTADEFLKDRSVIIVEDGMGRMVVFKNRGNFQQGGCAKPVVYLYPEKTTTLSIKVGAKVTKSDPQYESDGWQNVTATPDGNLTYQGQHYDSLFWEGQGNGTYPEKSGEGVVVPRANAVGMMYLQLAQQGFNQKESEDFVAFWSLNLPAGKYIRLTWLSTQDMNQLAPLSISTKPTTLIRTFLEMEGMNTPKSLTAQAFKAPARTGFTVTEWGGLAVNGLGALNYGK